MLYLTYFIDLPQYWHRHDDFEKILMHILKVELFYPPIDGISTRFRKFFNVRITICYEETLFFSRFFFSKPPYWISASTKLNSGDGFEKNTLENSGIPVSRRIANDSITFYNVGSSSENHGLLGVTGLKKSTIPKILKILIY